MSKWRKNLTEKNNDCLRLVKLGPEHIEEVRKALDTCARAGAQPWNADVNDYPGCMIDGDLKSGAAWGLFDDVGLVAYAVLDIIRRGPGARGILYSRGL